MSQARRIRRLVEKKLRNKMGDKRYFRILPDIKIMELDGKKPRRDKNDEELVCSHHEFIGGRVIDPAFAGADPRAEPPKPPIWDMRAVVSANTIQAIVRDKKPGDVVAIDEDDWERLKRGTEKGTYGADVAMSLIPFMREICDAKITKPEEPEAPATEEAKAVDPS